MRIVFITGASGSGKTTLLQHIEQSQHERFDTYYFDSVGVPSPEEMNQRYGSGEEWQRQTTIQWVAKILAESQADIAVLDGQMKLAFIQEACAAKGLDDFQIVLVDCNNAVRSQRLHERGQPDLANEKMMDWAKHLRDEAIHFGAQILDTSEQTISESESALVRLIES